MAGDQWMIREGIGIDFGHSGESFEKRLFGE